MQGRIFLNTNLYPNGHRLTKFNWTARLMPNSGLYFDFDIEFESYCEVPNQDIHDEELIWDSKELWANSRAGWIRSPTDQATGFLVGGKERLFNFGQFNYEEFDLDPIHEDWKDTDPCFDAYILDHDFVGGHTIAMRKQASGLFSVQWTGKIALSYMHDFEYNYNFSIEAEDIAFGGIRFPARLNLEEAKWELKKYVEDIDKFQVVYFQKTASYFPEPRFVPPNS